MSTVKTKCVKTLRQMTTKELVFGLRDELQDSKRKYSSRQILEEIAKETGYSTHTVNSMLHRKDYFSLLKEEESQA